MNSKFIGNNCLWNSLSSWVSWLVLLMCVYFLYLDWLGCYNLLRSLNMWVKCRCFILKVSRECKPWGRRVTASWSYCLRPPVRTAVNQYALVVKWGNGKRWSVVVLCVLWHERTSETVEGVVESPRNQV